MKVVTQYLRELTFEFILVVVRTALFIRKSYMKESVDYAEMGVYLKFMNINPTHTHTHTTIYKSVLKWRFELLNELW